VSPALLVFSVEGQAGPEPSQYSGSSQGLEAPRHSTSFSRRTTGQVRELPSQRPPEAHGPVFPQA
jgi:hypothetical protein